MAERRCELILAYYLSTRHKEDYEFEMKGRAEVRTVEPEIFLRDDVILNILQGYIAMGLSRDVTMGEDLTTNCVVRGNGAVDIVTGEVTSSRVTRDTVNSVTTSYIVTCNTVSSLVPFISLHFCSFSTATVRK